MKEIRLTNNQVAIVDDCDYELVNRHKWYFNPFKRVGYAETTINGRKIAMHRLVLGLVYGDGLLADHINMNGLDNRRCNLRIVNKAQNSMNSRARGKSNYKGVVWDKQHNRWRSQIFQNHQCIYARLYKVEEQAALMYDLKAIELFGEYARTNFF